MATAVSARPAPDRSPGGQSLLTTACSPSGAAHAGFSHCSSHLGLAQSAGGWQVRPPQSIMQVGLSHAQAHCG